MKQFAGKSIIVIVVLALVAVLLALPASAQETPDRSLTVNGFGQAYGSPDVAYVQLGVHTTSDDVVTGFAAANEQLEAVLAALRDEGVAREDMQTTGLFIYQETIYDSQTGMPGDRVVYRIGNSVNVTVRDVSRVGEIISAGISAGANSLNSLNFGIDDRAGVEQEARAAAVADARARAEALADLMGVTLGEPLVIVEGGMDSVFPLMAAEARAMGGADMPIEPGQLSVTMQVRVTFSID